MKPKLINELTILMVVLNPTNYLFISDDLEYRNLELIVATIIIIFGYWVLYKWWQGKNWARILVLITSVVAILNLSGVQNEILIQQILIIIQAVLGIFLLYWLNTKSVQEYFRIKKHTAANKI